MTPFGVRLRQLRDERAIALKDMAEALGVSAAYLSALEHGKRGRPTHAMVVAICAQLNIIWDEADELMRLAKALPPARHGRHRRAFGRGDRARQSPGRAHPQAAAGADFAPPGAGQDRAGPDAAPCPAPGNKVLTPSRKNSAMPDLDAPYLRQRDFSRRRLQEMTQAERAELLRRYADFVDHFRLDEDDPKPKNVRKWVPGESA